MTEYANYSHEDDGRSADEMLLDRLRSGSWLDTQVFPPMSWAVPGLIPEGFGLFTGPPKVGKSWAALGIGLAVAAGLPALGGVPTGDPRPVLLLALEDGERRLQGRCRHLLDDHPIPPLLDYVTRCQPADVLPLISAWLRRNGHQQPLVILDTLGKVLPPSLPGEGAYQRDYRIGSALKSLVDAHPGACLMVVHHTRKQAAEDWMDSTSGTNGLNGAADWTLSLSRARNDDTGLLRVTGRDVPEGEYAVTSASGRWSIDGDDLADAARAAAQARATKGLGDMSAEIVAYVTAAPEPVGASDVETALNITGARTYLGRLADAGRITKTSRGRYAGPSTNTVASVASVATRSPEPTNATHATVATPLLDGATLRPPSQDGVASVTSVTTATTPPVPRSSREPVGNQSPAPSPPSLLLCTHNNPVADCAACDALLHPGEGADQ